MTLTGRMACGVIAATLCLSGCVSVGEPSIAEVPADIAWQKVDARTGRIADIAGLEDLVRAFPDSATIRLRLLNARLQADDTSGAWEELVWLAARGHRFSPTAQDQLLALYSGVHRAWLAERFAASLASTAHSEVVATVPADAHLVESVIEDPATGRLFVSTVVSRQMWVRERTGAWSAIALEKADSLSGMAIDRHGVLWIASGAMGMGGAPADAFRGLIGLDTTTLREVRRIAAPAGVSPSDITAAPDGTIYASDPLGGGVYRARAGTDLLEVLVGPGTLRSPQGLALVPGGKSLAVSDYGYGLAAIDLASGRVSRLSAPAETPVSLDGIDGLWVHGDTLVAVQNGSNPRRILRIGFAGAHSSLGAAHILEQANPGWTEPLSGNIVDDYLFYVGNGQWDRFDENGESKQGLPPLPTEIRRLYLGKNPADAAKNRQ